MNAATLKEAVTGKAPEPAARETTPYERFRMSVENASFLRDVALLMGGEAQARTFVRVVLNAIQQTPRLLEADRRTLLLACMKAARDRLMPDGKEAVLNIYNTKSKDPKTGRDVWTEAVQYLPMSAGLIKKMYASGEVKMVDAAAVYANDGFEYERGDAPKLVHRPTMADDAGKIIAAYVVVTLTNGEIKREVMPRRDIETVRTASKAPDSLMWKTYYDQGAIKSVIKRAYKQLPTSAELEQVIAHDNEAMGFTNTAAATGVADAFHEQARPEPEQPAALEHNPGETIPPIVGAEQAKAETVAAEHTAGPDGPLAKMTGQTAPQPAAIDASATQAPAGSLGGPDPEATSAPVPTFAEVAAAIAHATTPDALAEALDLIRSVHNPAHRRELNILAAKQRGELENKPGGAK